MKKKILFFAILFVAYSSSAGLLLTYHQLTLKDLDEMNELVNSKLKESKKSSVGKVIPLREGLQAVFSRPNDDGMVTKVYTPLRNELDRLNALEKAYKDLVDEALYALKNNQNFKPDVQVSYAIFLENLIAEFKPLARDISFERSIIEKISKASVELTKEALKERKRRLMKEGESPSVIAQTVLKNIEEEKKNEEARQAEKAKQEQEAKNQENKK